MANTRPHDHYCPYCEERIPCEVAERDDYGCLFDATDDITCNECASAVVAKMKAQA